MKRLIPLLLVAVVSLFGYSVKAQVRIFANVNLPLPPIPPIPHVHVYAQAAPEVIYQDNYQPAPQYYPPYETERVVVAEPGYRYDGCYHDYRYGRFHGRHYRDEYRDEDEHHDRGHHYGWGRGDRRGW